MKKKKTFVWLLVSLCTIICASCSSDDDEQPLRILEYPSTELDYMYPYNTESTVSIGGGDGNYKVSVKDPSIIEAQLLDDGKSLELKFLKTGSTTVYITDNSQNTAAYNITIRYYETTLRVVQNIVKVVGKDITIKEKEELEQKAWATIPIKVGGGYKITYFDVEQQTGILHLYPEKFDSNGIEKTVDIQPSKKPYGDRSFTFEWEGKTRTFDLTTYIYDFSRSTGGHIPYISFIEEVTEQFKEEYPKVEGVYTQQILR